MDSINFIYFKNMSYLDIQMLQGSLMGWMSVLHGEIVEYLFGICEAV
jgi:hypothetical protein